MNWIEVFKAGKHTDSAGNQKEWKVEDLDAMVSKYNEQSGESKHDAPAIIGHQQEDPAYAWVEELKREDEVLLAKFRDVDPEFAELVNTKKFNKVSIALYPDMLLRHVAFLGAVPPAVKGLKAPEFSADKEFSEIEFEFADTTIEKQKDEQKKRAEKYGISPKDGLGYLIKPLAYSALEEDEFADPVNYLYPINDKANFLASTKVFRWGANYNEIEQQVIYSRFYHAAEKYGINDKEFYFAEDKTETTHILDNNFAEKAGGTMDEFIKQLTAFVRQNYNEETANQVLAKANELKSLVSAPKKDDKKEEFSETPEMKELREQLANQQKRINEMEFNEFFDSKVREGKLVPAQKEYVKSLFFMAKRNQDTIEFSEGTTTKHITANELLESFISTLEKKVEFKEFATGDGWTKNNLSDQDAYLEQRNKERGY